MRFSERVDFARRGEPPGNLILHGAGQSLEAFQKYSECFRETPPLLYMAYAGLKGFKEEFLSKFMKWRDSVPAGSNLQLGLSMTKDGTPEEHYEQDVAAGLYDRQIELLASELKKIDRPIYLRIGYEFNGHWNGYHPESYVAAWKKIVEVLRSKACDHVATVWCYAPEGRDKDFMAYYPGDDWVDWWSIDLFDVEHMVAEDSCEFMSKALEHGFPVMIGESTPRRIGVLQGDVSWEKWFEPYFDFIAKHPTVKAFCYINWEWSQFPMWSDWGDCRLEENLDVKEKYAEVLQDPIFVHAPI